MGASKDSLLLSVLDFGGVNHLGGGDLMILRFLKFPGHQAKGLVLKAPWVSQYQPLSWLMVGACLSEVRAPLEASLALGSSYFCICIGCRT